MKKLSLNRTNMGLKLRITTRSSNPASCLNRTNMGLKQENGIDHGRVGVCLNRTNMGLKQGGKNGVAYEINVLIEPIWD